MNEDVDDSLDGLLAQARWHGPSAESTRRLVERWEGLRGPRRYRVEVAAAGGVIVVSATVAFVIEKKGSKSGDVVMVVPVARSCPDGRRRRGKSS
jgi:hypothetical protein